MIRLPLRSHIVAGLRHQPLRHIEVTLVLTLTLVHGVYLERCTVRRPPRSSSRTGRELLLASGGDARSETEEKWLSRVRKTVALLETKRYFK